MKKTFVFTLIFALLLPFNRPLASSNNVLEDVLMWKASSYPDANKVDAPLLTDDDLTTYEVMGMNGGIDNLVYVFPFPITLTGYSILSDTIGTFNMVLVTTDDKFVNLGVPNRSGNVTSLVDGTTFYKGFYLINQSKENIKVYDVKLFSNESFKLEPITNLSESHTHNSINLSWNNPTHSMFSGVDIKQDGVKIASLPNTSDSYSIKSLEANTSYKFEVIAKFGDKNFADGVSITVTTDEKPIETPKDVTNLKVLKVEYNRVDLSWKNPDQELDKVIIYRKVNDKKISLMSLFSADEFEPIFETNGTTFNDLTVKSETSYTYLLTTEIDGVESEGVTVNVETPPVQVSGGDTSIDEETGDYVIRWTEPTTGKILVSVGGEEYAVVNASDLKIIIPKADMKFDSLGYPDVTLTPLNEDGEVIGKPSTPGGGIGGIGDSSNIFDTSELLLIAIGLLGLVSMFVLLGLGFRMVPKLIEIIKISFQGGKKV